MDRQYAIVTYIVIVREAETWLVVEVGLLGANE